MDAAKRGSNKKMKYHPHGSVLFITFSIEEGLLLLCNPLCEAIIRSCLARAQFIHPLPICGILVEPTHLHLLVVVDNPVDVPGFVRCFKTESSHMLNRVLGRKKRTVWCESYDDPIVLTMPRALMAMAYIYSNPAKDNIEESIESYPGVSSWKMFVGGQCQRSWKRLRRNYFRVLPRDAQTFEGYRREAERVLSKTEAFHVFTITPNAWLEAFGIRSKEEQEQVNNKLIQRVRKLEERAREKRLREKRRVIGAKALRTQAFDLTRQRSARCGKRMWCLSEKRSVRVKFIDFLKGLFQAARAVRARWMQGDFSVRYPLGLYPPSIPKLGEPIHIWG